MKGILDIDRVMLAGRIVAGPVFDHEVKARGREVPDKYFKIELLVPRDREHGYLLDSAPEEQQAVMYKHLDVLPCLVHQNILEKRPLATGDLIFIEGSLRTHNQPKPEGGSRVLHFAMVHRVRHLQDISQAPEVNWVRLVGNLWAKPTLRQVMQGTRHISDVKLAINHGKSAYYLHAIVWEDLAKMAHELEIKQVVDGKLALTRVELKGIFASRSPVDSAGNRKVVLEVIGKHLKVLEPDLITPRKRKEVESEPAEE